MWLQKHNSVNCVTKRMMVGECELCTTVTTASTKTTKLTSITKSTTSITFISNAKRQSIWGWVEVNYAHTIPAHGMSKVGLEDGGGWRDGGMVGWWDGGMLGHQRPWNNVIIHRRAHVINGRLLERNFTLADHFNQKRPLLLTVAHSAKGY